MALYGVGLDVTIKKIHLDLTLSLSKQPGKTLKGLERIFYNLDTNGYGKLSKKDFQAALAAIGFFPKVTDMQALFMYYDKNKDGMIDYNEFLNGMRTPLNERRYKLVERAWKKLDDTIRGVVDVVLLAEKFEPTKNKEASGKVRTKEELFQEFANYFGNLNLETKTGKITRKDFFDYYIDISVSIPSDQYFSELIQGTWSVEEDESSTIKKETIKHLVKNFRYKLIQLSKGSQDEYLLRKIFKEFDLNKTGYITIDELNAMMVKMDIYIPGSQLASVFSMIDKNKSGYIEFEEFIYFLIYDPYP